VAGLAVPYFLLTIGSTLFFSVSLAFESGMRATRDTATPLRISLVVTSVKLALNYLLIFGSFGFPRLDLVGAGLATLGSQLIGTLLFVFAARRGRHRDILGCTRADLRGTGVLFRDAVRISLPALGERVLMNAALMAYFWLLGGYGPVAVAAYTVGVRVLSFSWIPGTGLSIAASTLVGQALGAGDPRAAARAGWRATRMGLIVSTVLGAVFALAREPLGRAFTDDPAVIQALGPFMLTLALTQPMMGVHFTLGGALRGAGDTVTPLYAAVLGNWGLRVPLAFLAAVVLHTDVTWVWMALCSDHVSRAIWLAIEFGRARWAANLGVHAVAERAAR
jgi:putative MATE family efflux protein